MKKLLLLVLVVSFVQVAFSQIPAGTKYIGGSVGFSSSKSKADGAKAFTSYNFGPEFGYFFKDDMAVGVRLNVTGSGSGDDTSTGFGIGAYVRKYWNASDNLHVFASLGVDYNAATNKFGGNESKFNTIGGGLDFGVWYHLSERWSVVGTLAALGFTSSTDPDNDQAGSNDFGLGIGNTSNPFNLGVFYSF